MSQKNVEILLGKILTDEGFRRSFFPVQPSSFEVAAAHGLELTPVEQSALSRLRLRRFEFLARWLDPRISRSCLSEAETAGESREGVDPGTRGSTY